MNISIIIPVYNVEKYVLRCLDSITNQTYTDDIECIIVDDCGTDNSIKLVEDFIANYKGNIIFHLIKHDCNRGLATARNSGLKIATGKYILHIDSDDYCETNMLENYYKVATETDADIVVSDFWYTYKDHETYVHESIGKSKVQQVEYFFNHKTFTVNWNKLIKRSLYIDYNISYLDGVNYGEDFRVMFPLFFAAKRIEKINKAFVHYVQYNTNAYNHHLSKKSLEDYVINLNCVEESIIKEGIIEDCKNYLYDKQIFLRNMLLMRSKGQLQKEWSKYFPESRNRLFKYKINILYKLAIWFSYHGVLAPICIYRYIHNLIKKDDIEVYS